MKNRSWRGKSRGGSNNGGYNRNHNRGNRDPRRDVDYMEDGAELDEMQPSHKSNTPYRTHRSNNRGNGHQNNHQSHLKKIELIVAGIPPKTSLATLINFLEGKQEPKIVFTKSELKGNEFHCEVADKRSAQSLLKKSGKKFEGGTLRVRYKDARLDDKIESLNKKVYAIREYLQQMYDPGSRVLNLSRMTANPIIKENSISGLAKQTKNYGFSKSLFKIARELDINPVCVLFDSNQLHDTYCIEMIGDFLPSITQLSFKENNFASFRALEGLKKSKLNIEGLLLFDNPFRDNDIRKNGDDINYRNVVTDYFPNLKILDDVPVKQKVQFGVALANKEEATALPFSIIPHFFSDPQAQDLTAHFFNHFFNTFDNNRNSLSIFYDSTAFFSINLFQDYSKYDKPTKFFELLSTDRNLKKFKEVSVRSERLAVGGDSIIEVLKKFPATKHPIEDLSKFAVDSFLMPGLIPFGSNEPRPGSYINIKVNGEFFDITHNQNYSFDRNFVLTEAPPGSTSGLPYIILSDLIILRPYRKSPAWTINQDVALPEPSSSITNVPQPQTYNQVPTPIQPQNVSLNQQVSAPISTAATVPQLTGTYTPEQTQTLIKFMADTKLNEQYAVMCLSEYNWEYQKSFEVFNSLVQTNKLDKSAFQ